MAASFPQIDPRPLRGIAVEESLDGPAALVDAVPAGANAQGLLLIVRIVIDPAAFRGPGAAASLARLDARLTLYRARNISVILALGPFPDAEGTDDAWRQYVRIVGEHGRGKIAAYQVGDVPAGPMPAAARYAFLLKLAANNLRSIDSEALVIQGSIPAAQPDWLSRVYAEGVAPWTDGVAMAPPPGADGDGFRATVDAMGAVIGREDPSAFLVLGSIALSDQPAAATEQLVSAGLRALGTKVHVTVFRARPAPLRAALSAAARLADLFSGELLSLDASAVRLFRAGVNVTGQMPHRLLFSTGRSDTYLVLWGSGSAPVDVEVDISMATPAVRDAITGATQALGAPTIEGRTSAVRLRPSDHPLVLDFNFGLPAHSSAAEVKQSVLPSVEEIIAHYQQEQTAQDAAVRNYIAHMRMGLHFRPSAADPAYNLVTENRVFSDESGVEWEQLSFSLNGATWTSHPPSFPLLQPEKVLSKPLELRLNQDYRYRLDGIESVEGREAFIVRFDPTDRSRALYSGTVWIDRQTWVRLKLAVVQTRGSGVVASNAEQHIFAPAGEIGGRPIWLIKRRVSQQLVLTAGSNLLLEQEVDFSGFQLNAVDFTGQRAATRAGDRVMYRDTDGGIRYFVKQGDTRVVSDRMTTSARAFAMGAVIDPSFDYPLPIAGWNILDFNFLRRDMQLALLFGGVIAIGNIQRPHLWGGKLDGSVDFFGLALKANDAVFDGRGERRGERVRTIPFSTGLSLGYQFTPFQKAKGRYEFKYDAYVRDEETAAEFVTPSSTATNGVALSYEYRRRGYSATANASASRRSAWGPWGLGGAFDPAAKTYRRYDAGASKDFIFRTFHTVHINGQYFGGQRLDRFSMYQFGLFDATRIHGVPSAVRFAELAMLRGSYSFNLFDQYRVDLFLDRAIGRDPRAGRVWRSVTGLGIGLNLRGPRSTILRADIGRSFLPGVYRGAGSFVAQIMVLKPL